MMRANVLPEGEIPPNPPFLKGGTRICGLLIAVLLSTPALADGGSPVLATFRNPVTEAELESWLRHLGQAATADRARALQELILTRTLADEALRLGLDREPASRIELERKEAALARPLLHRQVNAAIHFSDEEVEAKYQSIKDTYTRPRRLRLRNIFKRYPPDASAEAKVAVRQQIEEIRRRLLEGADFAQLAEAESHSQTRLQGGLLGNVRPGTFRPEVDAIAMAMEAGQISEILSGPEGLTILYCEQVLEKVVRSPEEMREISRDLLANRAYKEDWARLEESLLGAAAPVYHSPDPDPDAVFVEYTGGSLSRAEVRVLAAGRRSAKELSEIPREKAVQAVEHFLKKKMMLREVYVRGLSDGDFEAKRVATRRQILAAKALAHLIQERLVPPTGEEVEELYRGRGEDFVRPLHYQLAVIALPLDPDDVRETYRQGELIVHRIGSGELSFEEAARRHSHDPSADGGGNVGWVSRWAVPGRFGLDFLRALLRMEEGERSDLVEDEGILWILELRGIEEERPMTFEEARTAAENRLGNQRVKALEAELVDEWLEKLEIEIAPDV